jgi:hypothetical protein
VVAAVIMNVMKRTVSRTLLACVAVGYGVVKPTLTRVETISISLLTVLYFAFSCNGDIRMWMAQGNADTQAENNMLMWQFPVTLTDIFFLGIVYFGLINTKEKLKSESQFAKLSLYQHLTTTLVVFAFCWFAYTLVSIAAQWGYIGVSYQYSWMISGPSSAFWHILFFCLLGTICYIWRPNENSSAYALSSQIAGSEEEAEMMDNTSSAASIESPRRAPHATSSTPGDGGEKVTKRGTVDVFNIGSSDED